MTRSFSDRDVSNIVEKFLGEEYVYTGIKKRYKNKDYLREVKHKKCNKTKFYHLFDIKNRIRCQECKYKVELSEIQVGKWNIYVAKAKERGLEFSITREYANDLFHKQNKKCALSGLDIAFGSQGNKKYVKVGTASLDRIDSSKGYIEGNVQWVHKRVNSMKMDMIEKDFVLLCEMIFENNRNRIEEWKRQKEN